LEDDRKEPEGDKEEEGNDELFISLGETVRPHNKTTLCGF